MLNHERQKLPDVPGLDFSGGHVLNDTRDLLDLFARPELMEHLDEAGLTALFERTGYQRTVGGTSLTESAAS